jgi:hypothetical protein
MNSFQLGGMRCPGRFVDNPLQIQKGEVCFASRKRPVLHFRIHENWLLIVSVGAGSLPLRFAEEKTNFLAMGTNGQSFVNQNPDQPAAESAVMLEPRWIARR